MIDFKTRTADVTIDARDGHDYAGSVMLTPWCDGLLLYRLYVAPAYRGRGIARDLVCKAIKHAGLTRLYVQPGCWADCAMSSENLRAWYERLGFRPTSWEGIFRLQGADQQPEPACPKVA